MNLEILDRLGKLQRFGPGFVTLRNDIEKLVRNSHLVSYALEAAEKDRNRTYNTWTETQRKLVAVEKSEQQWYDIAQRQDGEIKNLRSILDTGLAHIKKSNWEVEEIERLRSRIEELQRLSDEEHGFVGEPVVSTEENPEWTDEDFEKAKGPIFTPKREEEVKAACQEALLSGEPVSFTEEIEKFEEMVEESAFSTAEQRTLVDEKQRALLDAAQRTNVNIYHSAALSPEQQGRQAFSDHKLRNKCPYKFSVDQVKHNQWVFGWTEAQHDQARD